MPSPSGRFVVGPNDATLTLRTGTAGVMARAGHSLEIRVNVWSAQLGLTDDPIASSLSLDIDSRSLSVIDGSGGPKPLTDEDRLKITETINDRILQGQQITFRSTSVRARGSDTLEVHGELTLLGRPGPVQFVLTIDGDGHLAATAQITQTAFGIEPYSAMRGALKVKDELLIEVDGQLPPPCQG